MLLSQLDLCLNLNCISSSPVSSSLSYGSIYSETENTAAAIDVIRRSKIDDMPIRTCSPARSDFLVWYSAVRGFVSHREQEGSPFIRCLVTVFSRCAYELEIMEMVAKVNLLMRDYVTELSDTPNPMLKYMTHPTSEYYLTHKLYFNP